MEDTILICDCNSTEHQIVIRHDVEENEVYMQVYLHKWSFWRRLIVAVKYLFGYHCRYGHWDTFTFKKEHAIKLRQIVNLLDPVWKGRGQFVNTDFLGNPFPDEDEIEKEWGINSKPTNTGTSNTGPTEKRS